VIEPAVRAVITGYARLTTRIVGPVPVV